VPKGAGKNLISGAAFGYFPDKPVNSMVIKTSPSLANSNEAIRPENRWDWRNWRAKGNPGKTRIFTNVTGFPQPPKLAPARRCCAAWRCPNANAEFHGLKKARSETRTGLLSLATAERRKAGESAFMLHLHNADAEKR
jgi:hypothetical protein